MKKTMLTLFLATLGTAAFAQLGGARSSGINAAVLNFFGETKSFSARADVQTTDKSGKEISRMPMQMFVLDGKLRAEMDLSLMKGGDLPAEAAAMLKQSGLEKMVSVVRPDKQVTLILYPALKAYAEIPDEKKEATTKEAKVERTAACKETIDGHPCVKTKVVVTEANGKKSEGIVWNATDLKDFPVQLEMQGDKEVTTIRYTEPKFDKPDAKLFEAPDSYTKHASVQQLMQAVMLKMIGGQ